MSSFRQTAKVKIAFKITVIWNHWAIVVFVPRPPASPDLTDWLFKAALMALCKSSRGRPYINMEFAMLKSSLIGVSLVASLGLLGAAPALAKSKRHHHYQAYQATQPHHAYRHHGKRVGGFNGPNTYVAAPRSYGGNPAYARNVPRGRPDAFQAVNGCYGGRQQVRQGNRLVWVPDVTCPYNQDSF